MFARHAIESAPAASRRPMTAATLASRLIGAPVDEELRARA